MLTRESCEGSKIVNFEVFKKWSKILMRIFTGGWKGFLVENFKTFFGVAKKVFEVKACVSVNFGLKICLKFF